MRSSALIFDMDGVILDSEQVYQEIERTMFRELGIPVSMEEHRQFMGSTENALWSHMVHQYSLRQPVQSLILEERRRFLEKLEDHQAIPLIRGLIPLLDELQEARIPLMVASSSAKTIIHHVLEIKDLHRYFQGFVSGEEVSRPKPAPDIFLEAATRLRVDPSRCLVIEDAVNGVRAALSAGMKVIGMAAEGMDGVDLSEADVIVSDHTEITPGMLQAMLGG